MGEGSLLRNVFLWILLLFVVPMTIFSFSWYFSTDQVNQRVLTSFDTMSSTYNTDVLGEYESGFRSIRSYVIDTSESRMERINSDRAERYSAFFENLLYQGRFIREMLEFNLSHCGGMYNATRVANFSELSAERSNALACYGDMIRKIDTVNPDTSLIFISDKNGNMVFSRDVLDHLPEDFDPTERPWFLKGNNSDRTVFTEPYIDDYTGNLTTTLVTPFEASKNFSGYVGIDIPIENLKSDLSREEGEIGFLMDYSGDLLVCSNVSGVSESLCSNLSDLCSEINGQKVVRKKVEGTEYFLSHEDLSVGGWHVGMAVPEENVMSLVDRVSYEMDIRRNYVEEVSEDIKKDISEQLKVSKTFALIFLGFLVATGAFSLYVFYDNILRPIKVIKDRADKLSKGEEAEEIRVDAGGEIGDLAKSFNRLLRSTKIIERKISDERGTLESGN